MGFMKSSLESAELEYLTSASAIDIYKQHYSDIPLDYFIIIVGTDPTSKNVEGDSPEELEGGSGTLGKYSKQLLLWYKKKLLYPSGNLGDLREALIEYDENKSSIPLDKRDIARFKTPSEFMDFVRIAMAEVREQKESKEAAAQSKVFYEDGEWKIIIPETHFASRFYANTLHGEGESETGTYAEWCTAYAGSNYFNQYSRGGTLYMCMNKGDYSESHQVYIPDDRGSSVNEFQAADVRDSRETASALPSRLRNIFTKKGLDLYDIEGKFNEEEEEEEEEEEVHEDESSYEVYIDADMDRSDGAVTVEIRGSLNVMTRSWDYDDGDYGEWGDSETEDYENAEIEFSQFDYHKSDSSMLSFSGVPFETPGLVVKFVNGMGVDNVRDSLESNHNARGAVNNEDWENSVDRAVAILAGVLDYSNRWAHIDRENISRVNMAYVAFLDPGDDVSHQDDVVRDVIDEVKKYSHEYPAYSGAGELEIDRVRRQRNYYNPEYETHGEEGSLFYDGEEYKAYIVVMPLAADLAHSMENDEFRKFVQGPNFDAEKRSSTPEQEERDKQLKLELAEQRKKLFMSALKVHLEKRKKRLNSAKSSLRVPKAE